MKHQHYHIHLYKLNLGIIAKVFFANLRYIILTLFKSYNFINFCHKSRYLAFLWYNISMKSKVKVFRKNLIIILLCAMFAVFGSMLIAFQKPNVQVFADSGITNSTEIHNDGEILGSKLWKAVKRFYNDNKNEETSGRIHSRVIEGTEEVDEYFYPDIFENFNVTILNLSGKDIDDLTNFGCLNLNSFTKIDLSNNSISSVGEEFKNISNLQELDLSKNNLSSFSYQNLSSAVCSSTLQILNLSENEITSCNLANIAQGKVDLKLNNLTKNKLTLPTNLEVVVELSHNLIDEPDTTNPNIKFGFQRVKNDYIYNLGKKVTFSSFESVTSISIYSLTRNENDYTENELVATLNDGDEHLFALGYYKIKFVEGESESSLTDPIIVLIRPKSPTAKMIVDEEEKEVETNITKATTYKFYGDENATFEIYLNGVKQVNVTDSIVIKNPGINILSVYQVIDGYKSAVLQLFITYKEPQSLNWIFTLVGALVFAGIFYLAIKGIPALSKIHIGGKSNNKKDKLD